MFTSSEMCIDGPFVGISSERNHTHSTPKVTYICGNPPNVLQYLLFLGLAPKPENCQMFMPITITI